MIAIDTGKRNRAGDPVYMYVENNCFNIWHAQGREAAWSGICRGFLPVTSQARFNVASQLNESTSDVTGTSKEASATRKEETASDKTNTESVP